MEETPGRAAGGFPLERGNSSHYAASVGRVSPPSDRKWLPPTRSPGRVGRSGLLGGPFHRTVDQTSRSPCQQRSTRGTFHTSRDTLGAEGGPTTARASRSYQRSPGAPLALARLVHRARTTDALQAPFCAPYAYARRIRAHFSLAGRGRQPRILISRCGALSCAGSFITIHRQHRATSPRRPFG